VEASAGSASGVPVPCSAAPGQLSEGPGWDRARGELLWVDIVASRLHRGRPRGEGPLDELPPMQFDRHVGAAVPAAAGGYVLAAGGGFLFVDERGVVAELAQPEAGHREVRMNDGACDPQGRFWAGTMAYDETPGAGVLYRLELDGTCTTVLEGLTISNGIGWSPDATEMYLADSGTARVDAFDFDPPSGAVSRRRTIIEVAAGDGVPDGLTVDAEGNLWVALWGGRALRRYTPDGRCLATLVMSVDCPTSCGFGGPDGATLFITTAREGLSDEDIARQPDAGRVFRVDGLGVSGPPCAPYRGPLPDGVRRE
jgi:sugar lactone lactonase YvrE